MLSSPCQILTSTALYYTANNRGRLYRSELYHSRREGRMKECPTILTKLILCFSFCDILKRKANIRHAGGEKDVDIGHQKQVVMNV